MESGKISSALQARLESMAEDELIRLIVLVELGEGNMTRKRLSGVERMERVEDAKVRVEAVRREIEGVLGVNNGRFLPQTAPSLGALTIELQVAGVPPIAELDQVKTILEDQLLFGFTSG